MTLLLLACIDEKPRRTTPFQDDVSSGLDASTAPPFALLADEEVSACDWLRLETESVASDGTRFWFDAEILLEDALGFSQDDPGPWDSTGTVDPEAGVTLYWIDIDHPSGTFEYRNCSGARLSTEGSLCFGHGGTFTLHGERTASVACGDESAWALTFHAWGVEPLCTVSQLEATEFGPFEVIVEPSRCG